MRLTRFATVFPALAVFALLAGCRNAPVDGRCQAHGRAMARPVRRDLARRLARLQGHAHPGRLAHHRQHAREGCPRRRHRHEGRVLRLRARDRVEDRRGRQQRHLLPRHRGVRPHLLERPRVPAARRRQGVGQQDAPHLRGRRVRHLSVARGTPEAGGRVELHAHRREGLARRALAQRLQAARVRAREPRLAGAGEGEQVQRLAAITDCAKSGHIGLQGDHSGTLAFRNIRIRELK